MSMRVALALFALVLALFPAACGFEPVYGSGTSSPAAVALNVIDIKNIPDRSGQKLRNELMDRFYRDGRPADPRYALVVEPVYEAIYELGIAKDATSSRAQMRQSTKIALYDNDALPGSKPLFTRQFTATASYNTLGSQYTTLVTEEDARDQALRALADQITTALELYFARNQ